jgi:hypothetical protein
MKRYWVFKFKQYDVKGGMNDFIQDFDNLEIAIDYGRKLIVDKCRINVYDSESKRLAYEEGTWETQVQNPLTTFSIALPHVAPLWNLQEFVRTVDDQYWKHFVISDHSKNQDLKQFNLESKGAKVIYNPGGSISSAWNAAMKENNDFTIICSVSVRFWWGIEKVIDEFKRNLNYYAVETQWGFHLCAVTRELVNRVGLVDENFQAYAEDTDWRRRWNMAGVSGNRFNVGAFLAGLGIAQKSGEVTQNWKKTDDYYKCKWGGVSGREVWGTPYNEPDKDFTYWRKMTDEEITQRAKNL